MAIRPIFIPEVASGTPRVAVKDIEFSWFPGMAKSQKQKSICSLHEASMGIGIYPILEISSKSELDVGVELSAFNLMITTKHNRSFSVETAFQSSKIFEHGGPFTDLLDGSSIDAKRDIRLKESGNLVGFRFFSEEFPLKPRTYCYDWIYINALYKNKNIADIVAGFNGFTDIEFNPKKSINCQAYSAALFVSLRRLDLLDNALESPKSFIRVLESEYLEKNSNHVVQSSLL